MRLYLTNDTGKPLSRSLAAALWGAARAILWETGLERGEVGIILTGDELLHRLNRDYLQVDRPTDVLAFSYLEYEPEEPKNSPLEKEPLAVGDVFISLEQARKQARKAGHAVQREVLLLGLHGLLHLAAWDHHTPGAERAMRQKEDALLERFGPARVDRGHA